MSCYPNPELDIQPHFDYIEGIVRKIQPDLFDHIYRKQNCAGDEHEEN